ncbi:MAG: tetratricopeptide repeat protein [Actinomycetota bacterium]|nr:tetratricopeptide repeat protein [Actinomycetota bacterium]
MSQRELAFPGCSPAYISRIEAGDRIPSLQLLRELGRRLGVTEDYLASGSTGLSQQFSLIEAELVLRLDDLDRAHELYAEALKAAVGPTERSVAQEGLGQLAFRRGELRHAITLFEQALVTSGDEEFERPALAESLGRAYALLGELEPSITIFERCLVAFDRAGDEIQMLRFSCLLAYALSDRGDFDRAEQVVSTALASGSTMSDPYMRARLYWSKAKLRVDQGDAEGASRFAYHALAALEMTEDLHYTGMAHQLVAHIELERGRPEEALAHLEEGWPLVERTSTPIERANFLVEEARALARLGETERAAVLAVEVTDLLKEAEPDDIGRVYTVLAEIARDLGDSTRAVTLFERAVNYLERKAPNRDLVDVYAKLAELLEHEGEAGQAYGYMKKAVAMQQAVAPKRPA